MRLIGAFFLCMLLFTEIAMAEQKKTIYGYIEKVTLLDKNLTLPAKLDTGAKSASLNALNIQEIELEGKPYLRFTVPTKKGPVRFEMPFLGQVKIKVRDGEHSSSAMDSKHIRRPVVMMNVKLGEETRAIKVNLTSRKQFIYPLLLGRDAIVEFLGVVDPSLTFTLPSSKST